jgi:predicted RNA-binding Zn-ribbon protein involved in translation (DUF1610 family)
MTDNDYPKYQKGLNRKVTMVCPDCGHEVTEKEYELARFKYFCPACGEGKLEEKK